MEHPAIMYCRFCAELKAEDKLLYLENNPARCDEILPKLAFVNAFYVDVTRENELPKTMCLICYESLNKAYDFLDKVKKAQVVLTNIFTPIDSKNEYGTPKFLGDDDDRISCFGDLDFLPLDTGNKQDDDKKNLFNVKIELIKEEQNDSEVMLRHSNDMNEIPSLDVQDILDVALRSDPYTSNVTIYAKDLSEIAKKDVNSWKEYPWLCGYCNIEFVSIDTLRIHTRAVHEKCAFFVCIDCKRFKKDNFNSFLRHVRKHRKVLSTLCPYCDEAYSSSDDLTVHYQQHFVAPQVPCRACGEIFTNEENLKQHIQEFLPCVTKRKPRRKPGAPITVEELTCHICKNVYKNPNSLRDHIKRHKNDRKRDYTCDRCGKTFFNKGALTSHIMSHDEIRPYLCKICKKSFKFPNMLRRHVETHSGVKPFACEQCGRRFRLRCQLNSHQIVHTNEMPHVCQYCNKAFRFKQILKNHERQHTGDKPYSCEYCAMEFSNWSNYNKHMKRRHGTDTAKKKITPDGVFPLNPETGQIIQIQDDFTEWKMNVMAPMKRGRKKAIKTEQTDTSVHTT